MTIAPNDSNATHQKYGTYHAKTVLADTCKTVILPADTTYAETILHTAADTLKQRGQVYDSPEGERSMGKTVTAFNTITGNNLTEAEGWLLLQLLKDVRQWSKEAYHEDSAVDCVNYAALKAEALAAK